MVLRESYKVNSEAGHRVVGEDEIHLRSDKLGGNLVKPLVVAARPKPQKGCNVADGNAGVPECPREVTRPITARGSIDVHAPQWLAARSHI